MDDGSWDVIGAGPGPGEVRARAPGGAVFRVRRAPGDGWIGPLPFAGGTWWARVDDGAVPVADVLADGVVPADVAETLRARGSALAALWIGPDGAMRDGEPLSDALDLDDLTVVDAHGDPAAWWASAVAQTRLRPAEGAPARLTPGGGRRAPDKVVTARVAALVLALGLGAGWWIAPRAGPAIVEVEGASRVEIACGDGQIVAEGSRVAVPSTPARCRVSALVGPDEPSGVLDTQRGGKYRCRVSPLGLRCEQVGSSR